MTLPEFINVGGKRIPLEVTNLEETDQALGVYDSERRVIKLDESLLTDKRVLRDTLTHEVIHCALDLAGISFNTSGALSHKVEEQVVTAVESLAAPAIVRVWRI